MFPGALRLALFGIGFAPYISNKGCEMRLKSLLIYTFLLGNLGLLGKAHTGSTLSITDLSYDSRLKRISVSELTQLSDSLEELEKHYEIRSKNAPTDNVKYFKSYLKDTLKQLEVPFVLVQTNGEVLIQNDISPIKNIKKKYADYL